MNKIILLKSYNRSLERNVTYTNYPEEVDLELRSTFIKLIFNVNILTGRQKKYSYSFYFHTLLCVTHLMGFHTQQMKELSLYRMSRSPPTSVCGFCLVAICFTAQRCRTRKQEQIYNQLFRELPLKCSLLIFINLSIITMQQEKCMLGLCRSTAYTTDSDYLWGVFIENLLLFQINKML